MKPAYRRAVLGIALSIGILGALPTAALGAQPSCGDTLMVNTTLTANLNCSGYSGTALYMGADDIVLNLNGKTITGPTGSDSYSGVDTNSHHRTTIRNGKINNYETGVYVQDSRRTLVQGIQIAGENTEGYGAYVYYGIKNTFNNLTISGVETGIYAEYAAQTRITNSTLSGDLTTGEGIYLYDNVAATVSGNHVNAYYGTYEYVSHRNVYSGNTATGGAYGFYFDCDGDGQVTVTGNTSTNSDSAGFSLNSCYIVDHPVDGYIGTRVTGNTSTGSNYGFESYNSFNELWRENVGNDNDYDGFWFEQPSHARIVYNTALRNGGDGFRLYDNGAGFNVEKISFNTARRNDVYGLRADYGAPGDDNVATLNGLRNCKNVDC